MLSSLGDFEDQPVAITIEDEDDYHVLALNETGAAFAVRIEEKMSRSGKPPTIMGKGQWALLFHPSGDRAMIYDTHDKPWEDERWLKFKDGEEILDVRKKHVIVKHATSNNIMSGWRVPRAKRLFVLRRSAFEKQGIKNFDEYIPLPSRDILIRDHSTNAALLFSPKRKLIPVASVEARPYAPETRLFGDLGVLFEGLAPRSEGRPQLVDGWFETVFDDHGYRSFTPRAAAPRDVLSATDRWFGYCSPQRSPCRLPEIAVTRAPGTPTPALNAPKIRVRTRDSSRALWVLLGSCVIFFLAAIWTLGVGRRVDRGAAKTRDSEGGDALNSSPQTHYDPRGHRYILQEDRLFLKSRWTPLPLRLFCAALASVGMVLWLASDHLLSEPLSRKTLFYALLAIPPFLGVFFLTSWRLWTRKRLLKQGFAAEGRWVKAGGKAIEFTPARGNTVRIGRGQWRADNMLPLVLYDPRQPRCAVQYIGSRPLGLEPLREATSKVRGTTLWRVVRTLFAIVFLVGPAVAIPWIYAEEFSAPLPESALKELEARNEGRILIPCLERCEAFEGAARDTCHLQCRERQMAILLSERGVTLEGDPMLYSTDIREAQADVAESLIATVRAASPALRCDALAEQIAQTPRWTSVDQASLARYYTDALRKIDPAFNAVEARFEAVTDFNRALCSPSSACLSGAEPCPAPPDCAGRMVTLREALCAWAPAVTPLGQSL